VRHGAPLNPRWRPWFRGLSRRAFLLTLLAGWALIAVASLPYFDPEALPPFVIEKLPVRFEALWLVSLEVHVASAIVSLPLCLLLMTRTLQRRPRLHHWLGRFTGLSVLAALVPSGVVLAFDAKGGAVVAAGFLLSGGIVAVAMVHGILAARRRDLRAHARGMWHVVAQMSVAVTSRASMLALDATGVDPDFAYVVALWGPVLASALTTEWIFRRPSLDPFSISLRFIHDVSYKGLAHVRSLARPVVRSGR
jgi:hypothetical protein